MAASQTLSLLTLSLHTLSLHTLTLLTLCASCGAPADDSAGDSLPAVGHPSGPLDIPCQSPDLTALAPPEPLTVVDEHWLTYLDWLESSPHRADETGSPNRAIRDLAVFGDQLYVGVGDWGYNPGSLFCAELAGACVHEDADGHGLPLYRFPLSALDQEAPAATWDFIAQEEEASGFRRTGDALFLPSRDTTLGDAAPPCAEPDADPACPDEQDREHPEFELGNHTALNSGGWATAPLLEGALHVLDLTVHNGDIVAVGSGQPYERYDPMGSYGMIWRSVDDGVSWSIDHVDEGADDKRRLTGALALDGGVIVLGRWYTEPAATPIRLVSVDGSWQRQDGAIDGLLDVGGTQVLDGSQGLVWERPGSGGTGAPRVLSLDAQGQVVDRALSLFEEQALSVVDTWLLCAGDLLVLSHGSNGPDGTVHVVHRSRDLDDFEVVLTWTSHDELTSLTVARDRLYFGGDEVTLWRTP